MFMLAITSVAVAIMSVVFWLSRMRKIDRLTLIARIMFKLKLHTLLGRPVPVKVTLSNGHQILCPMPFFKDICEEIFEFKMRRDDIVIATYAKAGTTWMQEIVWLICNNADTRAAKETTLINRYGFLEAPDMPEFGKGFQSLEKWPKDKRRFIKTHLPFELLPKEVNRGDFKGKMIYVARNPKDNCVSFYHFHRMTAGLPLPGTWSEFLNKFCTDQMVFGSWFDNVFKYWQVYQERQDCIYFVTYETLKKDLRGEVVKLAKFLEKDLSEEQIDVIVRHCSFSSMSKNSSTNYSEVAGKAMDFKVSKFMRKGEVGDWKNHFTVNENMAFDKLYEEKTKDWTLKFEFEPATSQ